MTTVNYYGQDYLWDSVEGTLTCGRDHSVHFQLRGLVEGVSYRFSQLPMGLSFASFTRHGDTLSITSTTHTLEIVDGQSRCRLCGQSLYRGHGRMGDFCENCRERATQGALETGGIEAFLRQHQDREEFCATCLYHFTNCCCPSMRALTSIKE